MKKLWLLIFALLFSSPAFSSVEWNNGAADPQLQGTISVSDIDYNTQNYIVDPLERLLLMYKDGMKITYDSGSQFTVTAGAIVCTNTDGTIRKMRRNTTNTTVTWSDLDTGSEASATTYYVYAICDADATTATFKFSASASNDAPSGTTYFRRLGYFYNDSSSNISKIVNDNVLAFGDWVSKSQEVSYAAATDGIVTAWAAASSSGAFLNGLSDSATTPSTRRAYAESPSGYYFGISFPVKAGDYYKVDGDNVTNAGMYFLPLQ